MSTTVASISAAVGCVPEMLMDIVAFAFAPTEVDPTVVVSAEAAAFLTTPSVLVVASGTVRLSSIALADARFVNSVVASVKLLCDTLTDISL